ncbi:hypothetical protein, partial [Planomonospora algeriensis]
MSIIGPFPHHVSPFGGTVSPGSAVTLGVGFGVVVGGGGVGVGVVGVGLGVGDVVGSVVGVADVLTVADGDGEGRGDLVGGAGGRVAAGLLLPGVAVGDAEVRGSGVNGFTDSCLSSGPVMSWNVSAPSPTAAAQPAATAVIAPARRSRCGAALPP